MQVFGNPVSTSHSARFPAHGWAEDVEGTSGLFFPILTVLQDVPDVGESKGFEHGAHRAAVVSFTNTLWKLAVVLRDLEKLAHTGWASNADDGFALAMEAFERAPILIDSAFGYLRRLADRFARAAAPVLFGHLASSPYRFKPLLDSAGRGFSRLAPLVDGDELRRIFIEHVEWFVRIRGPGRGLRDVLEHDPVEVDIALLSQREGEGLVEQRLEAVMSRGPIGDELVEALRELCAGLCQFLTEICRLAGHADGYRYADGLMVSGPPKLVIAFWPQI